jgi:Zn-dependent peptidase ImmA (M78 family)
MSPRRHLAHRDPDILAFAAESNNATDPRELVITRARELNERYRAFDAGTSSSLERVIQLASMCGYDVSPMEPQHHSQRDAVVMRSGTGRGGYIFFNPDRPPGRVAFSIAHEISHTFFPATNTGAQFRELISEESDGVSELEMLCHAGAAELLMPIQDFQRVAGNDWTIRNVPRLMQEFGASFEATVFRLATAHQGIAVAGSARFRRTKGDEEKLNRATVDVQGSLFGSSLADEAATVSPPRYRRQSLHRSEHCPKALIIPWNKSFDPTSCLYRTERYEIAHATETLPVGGAPKGKLEAVDAPYQRPGSDPDHPDVLFFWRAA